MSAHELPTVFLTNEQIVRMAGLSCDALSGLQFRTDDSDQTVVSGCFVQVDNPSTMTFFAIEKDGRCELST